MSVVSRRRTHQKAVSHWNEWDWFYIGGIILLLIYLKY